MDQRSNLWRSGRHLVRWWWLLLVMAVLGSVVGHTAASHLQVYRASTTILVGAPVDAPFQQIDDIDASEHLARVLVEAIPQESVLDGVIGRLGLETTWRALRSRVQVTVEGQSKRLVLVTATATSAAEAEAIVGEIPRQLEAAVFGPGERSNPTKTRGFMWSRLDAMQRHIARAQHSVAELRRSVASDPRNRDTKRQLDDATSLLTRWNQDLTSMFRGLEHGATPDYLETIEPPATSSGPLPPQIVVDVGAGVVGAMIGLVIAMALELARRRHLGRRQRDASAAYVSG